MQITGSYSNYLTMTNLLAPLGVGNAGQIVMQVFSSAIDNLRGKLDQKVFSEESESAIKALYKNITDLSNHATTLILNDPNSVFYDRTAVSSDSSVLEAMAVNAFSADSGATIETYDISVTQLAETQKNTGLELNGEALSAVNSGVNTFNLHIQGLDHAVNVEILEEDNNEDTLWKIALAINDENVGITAEVVDGSTAGTKRLEITSQNSGSESAFEITDIMGNATAATGMNTVETLGKDAQYQVDGNDLSSSTNTIYLDDGLVMANLKATGETSLAITPDQGKINEAVTGLVAELNTFMEFLEDNEKYIEDKVLSSINTFISTHKNALASLGITPNEDGRLEIDDAQLTAGLNQDMDAAKEVFADFDGLAVQVNNLASQVVTASPLEYAKEAQGINMEFADFLYSASADMLQSIVRGTLLNSYV